MSGMNFRDAYEFDPETYGGEGGGLPGMMRRYMEQQRQQQGVDFGSTPNVAPNFGPETSFSPQGGLLGRLLALQAEQARQQPFAGNSGAAPLRSLDPNFGQLSRAPVASRMQGAIDVPNPSVDQAGPTPAGGGTSFDSLSATAQRGGLLGAYRGTPVPPWIVSSPAMTPVPLGWRGRGIPMPPMGPARLPPVPLPAVPEWWKTAWKILQFDPTNWSGRGDGGNDDYRRCIRAADGRTNDWEDFCRNLSRGQNNTSGGESQNRACWSKTYESPTNKKQWCENQFGTD